MADAVLSIIVTEIVNKLGSVALQEIQLACGVKNEACKLGNTVSTIKAVLRDAQEKQATDHEVEDWLQKLNDAVHDANDLLDDFSIETLRRKVMTQNKSVKKVRIFFSSSNQLLFSLKMGHQVKAIRVRLNAIAEDRNKFRFIEQPLEMQADQMRMKRETHSSMRKDEIIGRDNDKNTIVELLLMDCNVEENVSIVTIVGIGGLGKTELAKLVYNDEKVTKYFECKMWVCVSDVFDVKQIAEKIVESASGRKPESLQMEGVKNELGIKIDEKKYLLILDDVWNEDRERWIGLKNLLMGGAKGSKILITTRTKLVATVMGTNSLYPLRGLSDEESWFLFKQMAFKEGKEPENPCLVNIGKEIVNKCAGVPLAIRVIGSLLYSKDTVNEWSFFKDKNMSQIAQEENNIIPILKLSYDHLPWDLKQCFAFCHLYPKDSIIDKQQLIQLWIAHGFIRSSNENQDMEDVGDSCFMNLLRRSFFQDEEIDEFGNIIRCKMHDFMHDLAQSVAGTESCLVNLDTKYISERTRHVSFDCVINLLLLRSLKMLRTFFFPYENRYFLEPAVCERIVYTFKRLRVLDMHDSGLERMPSCISELRHLRYLDLSYNGMIKELPNSITKLQNLQTLKLTWCEHLKELPRDMRNLVSLRHLEIYGCKALSEMPRGLGQLTCLRTLNQFNGNSLTELKDLNNLRGELRILLNPFSKRATPKEAEEANLKGKEYLQYLYFNFEEYDDDDGKLELVLEALRPHANLMKLKIDCYSGVRLPTWMSFLPNVVEIVLWQCEGCKHLPKLEHLPSLRTLDLSLLGSVEYIDDGIEGESFSSGGRQEPTATTTFFPSLKHLHLFLLPNLKGWWRSKAEEDEEQSTTNNQQEQPLLPFPSFPCLVESEIENCPKLKSMPLQPTVVTLFLNEVSEKVVHQQLLMMKATNMEKLQIRSIDDLVILAEEAFQCLTSLPVLKIDSCPRLTSLSRGMRHLTALQSLEIRYCQMLDLSNGDDDGMHFQGLRNLTSLDIGNNPKMKSLPAGLQYVTTLQHLSISYCENLTSLPEWIGNLTSLQQIHIYECLRLTSLPQGVGRLTALQSLEIHTCPELDLSNGDNDGMHFQGLRNLTSLSIVNNPKMESLPAGLQYVTTLQHLSISDCENLMSLPEWIGNLTSLQQLEIYNCNRLTSLPEGMRRLIALQNLKIYGCLQELEERCRKETGEDWPKIAHIPSVYIEC